MIICSERGRKNFLLVNGSCIVLGFFFLPCALIIFKNMNIMNTKIQKKCMNSLYSKARAVAIIHLNMSKWIGNSPIHEYYLENVVNCVKINSKNLKITQFPLHKILISQFKIMIEPREKIGAPPKYQLFLWKRKRGNKVSLKPLFQQCSILAHILCTNTSRKET